MLDSISYCLTNGVQFSPANGDTAVTLFGPGDDCALAPKKGGQEIGLPFFLYGYSTKYYLLDIIGNIIAEVLPGHEYTVCTAGFVFV